MKKLLTVNRLFLLCTAALCSMIYAFSYLGIDHEADADRLFTLHNKTETANNSGETKNTGTISGGRLITHPKSPQAQSCIEFNSETRTIKVSCSSNLTSIDMALKNPAILRSENNGIWLLNANVTVARGATLTINKTDTTWLKINSTTSKNAYHLDVLGNLQIDSVKISSWNTTSNNYTLTDGRIHRAYIVILPKSDGRTNITNSEISYLGYSPSFRKGISYTGGTGSVIKNNIIHHLWYGVYSKNVSKITIEDNKIHSNSNDGIDITSGTSGTIIRNNLIHENNGRGIQCSLICSQALIEGNIISGNNLGALTLSRNSDDSIIRNNIIRDGGKGIDITNSSHNLVYNNTIIQVSNGIETRSGSADNKVYKNYILNSTGSGIIVANSNENIVEGNIVKNAGKYGICVYNNGNKNKVIQNSVLMSKKYGICVFGGASGNTIESNLVQDSLKFGLFVSDADSKLNNFTANKIVKADIGAGIENNTETIFTKNIMTGIDSSGFSLSENSRLKLINANLSSENITSTGNNSLNIVDSGLLKIRNSTSENETIFDTTKNDFNKDLLADESLVINNSK